MKSIILLLSLFCLHQRHEAAGYSCPEKWVKNGDSGPCYYVSDDYASFDVAKQKCESLKSELVPVLTLDTELQLNSILAPLRDDCDEYGNCVEFWIGVRDLHGNNEWATTQGIPVDKQNQFWAKTYPKYRDRRCVLMSFEDNISKGVWKNEYCGRPLKFVCILHPRDCTDIRKAGNTKDGVYKITVGDSQTPRKTVDVFCDLNTNGEGWLVFQSRKDGKEDFFRGWMDYARGFGAPTEEHWLGNDVLHAITSSANYKLRVDLTDFEGNRRFAEYSKFSIGSASDKYRLTVSGYSGNAGDSLTLYSGMAFTTKDVDNDLKDTNCALENDGAWWYKACYQSNLNGRYLDGRSCKASMYNGINWLAFHDTFCPMKTVEMKIARLD